MKKINITVDDIREAVYRCVCAINESVKKPMTVLWLDGVREPFGGDEDLLKEDIDEWGKRPVYSYDDKLEFIHDDNIKNGGNFGIKRNGREYWVSRSNCISLYVYCKNSEGEWCILASKRGPKMRNPNKWNVVCGFLDYGYSLESTAVKECWEETGVKINKSMLRNNGTNSSRTNSPVSTRFSCVLNGTTDNGYH